MVKKKWFGFIAVAFMFVAGVMPVDIWADESQVEKFSVDNAEEINDSVNSFISENEKTTSSVSIVVFDDKQEICSVLYGDADRENDVHADENTVYEWGSISKLLVWTSAMQLYEQGKLDLNEDIRNYLPDGFLDFLTFDNPITMFDLMNHSAGFLSPYKDIETDAQSDLMALDEALTKVAPSQQYRPGEHVAYSNYGAALAGYVVQCVSEMDYADYVNENIFKRLGMNHTAIRPDLSDNEWVANQRKMTKCYAWGDGDIISLGECRRYIHLYPAGSATGTISDLAIFARAFVSDDCPLFDKADTLKEMLSPSLYYADGKTPRFCHGLMEENAGVTLLGHGGNTEGFSSLLQFDPESRTGFVMMTNMQLDKIYKGGLSEILYGKQDLSKVSDESFKSIDISGHYKMTGGMFDKGCMKAYSLFADYFIVNGDADGYTGNLGVVSLKQISDNAVLVKLVTGNEYIYFIRSKDGVVEALQNGSLDFVKVSDASYYISWGILIMMFVGVACIILLTAIHAIRLKRHKGKEEYKYKKVEMTTGVMVAAMALCMYGLYLFGMNSMAIRAVICIVISLLTLAMAAGRVLCIKNKPVHRYRIITLVESVCSMFIVAGVIYWELWRFW